MKFAYFIIFSCLMLFTTIVGAEWIIFEQEGQYGYKNEKNQIIIPAKFVLANDFTEYQIASVVDEEGWAYINTRGQIVIRPFIFDNGPDYFVEECARFVEKGKMGFFNEKGEIVIAAQFDFVRPFENGVAAFCMNCKMVRFNDEHSTVTGGEWGYVDKTGQIIVKAKFASEIELKQMDRHVHQKGD